MNLKAVFDKMNRQLGVEQVADLGNVYRGMLGYADCVIALEIEAWKNAWYVRLLVTNSKPAGRKTTVIKWPYSDESAQDLGQVLADLQAVDEFVTGSRFNDTRGVCGRFLDAILRTTHLGKYEFTSLLEADHIRKSTVEATVVRFGGKVQVTLTEFSTPGVIILAQIPGEAIAAIRGALEQFAPGAS